MELHGEEVAGSRHDPGSFLDLSQRLHLSHYRLSGMTNYSNDLVLSRLLPEDLMFCINDNVIRDRASVDMKCGSHCTRVRGEVPNHELI